MYGRNHKETGLLKVMCGSQGNGTPTVPRDMEIPYPRPAPTIINGPTLTRFDINVPELGHLVCLGAIVHRFIHIWATRDAVYIHACNSGPYVYTYTLVLSLHRQSVASPACIVYPTHTCAPHSIHRARRWGAGPRFRPELG